MFFHTCKLTDQCFEIMPPRKNNENTAKKTPRKRVVKPKLKSPTVIKVKIPKNPFGSNGITPKLNRKPNAQEKLELANEVALAQLCTKEIKEEETPQAVVEPVVVLKTGRGKRKSSTTVKEPAQRKRQKKNTVNDEVLPQTDSEEVFEQKLPKKRDRKKPVGKTTTKIIESKDENNKTCPPPIKKKRGRQKITVKPIVEPIVIKEEIPDINETMAQLDITERNQEKMPAKSITNTRAKGSKMDTKVAQSALIEKSTRSLRLRKTTPKNVTPIKKGTVVELPVKESILGNPKVSIAASRKDSMNSSTSCPSWIQDISTSTTTCVTVTSGDFVRLDGKMPLVQVVNCQSEPVPRTPSPLSSVDCQSGPVPRTPSPLSSVRSDAKSSSSSSSSTSSCSSSSASASCARRLDLSATTPSDPPSPRVGDATAAASARITSPSAAVSPNVTSLSAAASPNVASLSGAAFPHVTSPSGAAYPRLDDMSSLLAAFGESLRRFEADIVPWGACSSDAGAAECARVEAALAALPHESEVKAHCRDVRRLAPGAGPFARPAPPPAPPAPAPDRADHTYDDDDALSLYAESITAIEPSRLSTSSAAPTPRHSFAAAPTPRHAFAVAPAPLPSLGTASASRPSLRPARARSHEEYIPTPVAAAPPETRHYLPTRIVPAATSPEPRPPVCEKHSADSTSLREADAAMRAPRAATTPTPALESESRVVSSTYRHQRVTPVRLTAASLRQSSLFRGMCFYYLTSHCRFENCHFSHEEPSGGFVRLRCAPLGDAAFLRELSLVMAHPLVLRRLGLAMVGECARRGLTRAALEAAASVACVAERAAAGPALEAALGALSGAAAELPWLGEALALRAGAEPLGDAMLRALAETANFSRFRGAFGALAASAARRRSAVPLPVAQDILQRVCILPSDAALAQAMLALLDLTDPAVWRSDRLPSFEAQLRQLPGDLYRQFLSRRLPAAASPPPKLLASDREERYTSPDTTHYDLLTNLPVQPTITRTVDFTRSQTNTTLVTFNPSVPPPNQAPVKTFNNWSKGNYPQHRPLLRPGKISNGPIRTQNAINRTPNANNRTPNANNRTPNANNRTPPSLMGNLVNLRMKKRPIPYGVKTNYPRPTNPRRSGGNFYD